LALTDGTSDAPPVLQFANIADAKAYDFVNFGTVLPIAVSVAGNQTPGDHGGGILDYYQTIKTTTGSSISNGSTAIALSSITDILLGNVIAPIAGIANYTVIVGINTETEQITISKPTIAAIASGTTLSIYPRWQDDAFCFPAGSVSGGVYPGSLVWRNTSDVTFEQLGIIGDYIDPVPNPTTAATAAGATAGVNNVLTFGSIGNVAQNDWVHHPCIPFGATIGSITLSGTQTLIELNYVTFDASIANGNTMTIYGGVSPGFMNGGSVVAVGMTVQGAGVVSGTTITAFQTGANGGNGNYTVSQSNPTIASTSMTGSWYVGQYGIRNGAYIGINPPFTDNTPICGVLDIILNELQY
jgi:hypothetical protein